jgi:queuine tRNA-ribosyltransferase
MSASRLNFRIEAEASGSRARAATFRTLHNEVLTPLFMPVGTQATVKAQLPQTLEDSGSQILLANTYHLLLRPGPEVFRRTGGIHGFMSWPKSVLTDSGGFQIFSLPHARSMTEEGAVFQSYIDGRTLLLSPEVSIGTQMAINSDIMMALDQCVASTADEATSRAAVELTQRWAARSLAARGDSPQSMFAIIQGALYPELRKQSAAGLTEMPFDGFAIGGLAVGEGKSEREDMCAISAELLPRDKPRYLMGVGTPLDILEAVHRGVDMFDCIIPTQVAQRGGVFTSRGFLQMRRGIYKFSEEKLDPACSCPTCARYSRAYLHHLTKTKETLGWQLLGKHNIHFYHQLMREIRQSILEDRFLALYHEKRAFLHEDDLDNPINKPIKKHAKRLVLGDYEVHTAREGFSSILHRSSGEIMHSRNPPMEEAQQLYVEQSHLATRLWARNDEEASRPLVLWDVGLGAAANAMAAIRCYEAQVDHFPTTDGSVRLRPLHIVSFENDLDSLRLAFANNERFPYLRHSGPHGILKDGHWQSRAHSGLHWELITGDFVEKMTEAPGPPEVIFYDMFSSKTTDGPWTLDAFRRLFAACQGSPAELFTYTVATSSRVAFLSAGFHVARGRSTGPKHETTIAVTPAALQTATGRERDFLDGEWLKKWERSGAKYPAEIPLDQRPAFEQTIRTHPQFQSPA